MKTDIGKQYCVTSDSECEIVDTATNQTIHLHHAGEGQSYFTAIGLDSEPSDDSAIITPTFKGATAGNGSGGGYIESDLNVGHDAADAVAAVCTLTLGDLGTGGTLADSNGQSVELENPHKYAEGGATFRDASLAGTLTIGEWSKEWEAQPGAYATGYFLPISAETQLGGTLKLMRGEEVVYSHEFAADAEGTPWTIASVKEELEADADWPCTILDEESEIDFQAPVAGESWNDVVLVLEGDLFSNQYYGGMEGGGEGARTAVDVFNDIHEDPDCPVDVTLDEDEPGLGFIAKEYGVNDAISADGDMFINWSGMSGGHGDYSVAELVTAIEGEFDDITPTAGETEGTIVLTSTATEHQADANRITYTASGCFGSGTVKQGSTTRGKDAVTQTDYEIVLNGGAPQPLDLTSTEPLKHGHVYTLAVAADTDMSALTVKQYATCELWLDYTAGSVTWPEWLWLDGSAPTLEAGNRYRLAFRNEGESTVARVTYNYATPAQS